MRRERVAVKNADIPSRLPTFCSWKDTFCNWKDQVALSRNGHSKNISGFCRYISRTGGCFAEYGRDWKKLVSRANENTRERGWGFASGFSCSPRMIVATIFRLSLNTYTYPLEASSSVRKSSSLISVFLTVTIRLIFSPLPISFKNTYSLKLCFTLFTEEVLQQQASWCCPSSMICYSITRQSYTKHWPDETPLPPQQRPLGTRLILNGALATSAL